MQYRATGLSSREILSRTRELLRVLGQEIALLVNSRSDLCLAAGFDGVHLGENDLSPDAAKAVLENRHWVGVSTHTVEQVRKADVRRNQNDAKTYLESAGSHGWRRLDEGPGHHRGRRGRRCRLGRFIRTTEVFG